MCTTAIDKNECFVDKNIGESASVDVAPSVILLIKLGLVEAIFIVVLLFAILIGRVLAGVMIFDISASVVVKLVGFVLRATYDLLIFIIAIEIVIL